MTHARKAPTRLTALLLATTLSATAGFERAAWAQAAIEEIVVTTRKRSESLQDVPLAITAFSTQDLEQSGIRDFRDLTYLTPGLKLVDFGASLFNAPVIRGLSQTVLVGESNVGTFLDGVYVSAKSGVDIALLDLERVEIVKGPQSSLYGRNTFAGAINYVTRKPGDAFEAKVDLMAGSAGAYRTLGSVSGPLVADRLGASLSLGYDKFAGTYDDAVTGDDIGGYRKANARFALLLSPADSVRISGSLYYGNDEFKTAAIARLAGNCGVRNLDFCGETPQVEDLRVEATTNAAVLSLNDREVWFGNVSAEADLGWATLSSLTGYNNSDVDSFGDFDKTARGDTYALFPGPGTVRINVFLGSSSDIEDFSEELRLASPEDQALRWSVAGFYYKFDSLIESPFGSLNTDPIPTGQRPGLQVAPGLVVPHPFGFLFTGDGSTSPLVSRSTDKVTQYSIYGDLRYDISEQFTAGLELRHTWEKKRTDTLSNAFAGGRDTDGPGRRDTFKYWDPRFTLDYRATDDAMLYAAVAKGTKAGGFNANATIASEFSFAPERNWTYEIGVKSTLLDRRLRLNGSAFYIDWTDLQLPSPSSDTTNISNQTKNIGAATSKGIEVESLLTPDEAWTLGAGLAYTDATFSNGAIDLGNAADCAVIPSCRPDLITVLGRSAINLRGRRLQNQAKWQVNLNATLTLPLTDTGWDWFARADYIYTSKMFGQVANFTILGDRNILNTRIGVQNEAFTVSAFVDNLLDDTTPTFSSDQIRFNTLNTEKDVVGADGLRWGLRLIAKF
jgi:iron complex outermembrane receptor protein